MRLLIVDDHDLVRETIAAYLEREGFDVVRQARDLDEALGIVADGGTFDVTLLDYNMPGMNGLEGLTRMREACADRPVALLSGVVSRELAEAALKAGAAGYLPKTLAARAMVAGIRLIAKGGTFAPQALLMGDDERMGAGEASLTRRELSVLSGICAGKANKEIARDLDLQEVTVKLHVKTLCRKLGARNRTHAAMIARDQGLG